MRVLCLLVLLIASTGLCQGQTVDTEQKKSWIYLFNLAQGIEELERCAFINDQEFSEEEKKRLWASYHRRVSEYVSEIDLYIKKYTAAARDNSEVAESFRFRVWKWTLQEAAAAARELGAPACRVMF